MVEQEEVIIDSQQCGKHVSAATNEHETVEEMLEACFLSVGPADNRCELQASSGSEVRMPIP
jgi:hypothetical protein